MFILCLLKEMSFVDQVRVELSAGCGGPGAVHFQSSRKSPRRGPDGGDGGRGGDLLLTPDPQLRDLSHLKPDTLYRAGDGKPGGEAKKKGGRGKNLCLPLPPHTLCYDLQGHLVKEITDQDFLILSGGKGGRGNVFFKTSRLQAPLKFQKGGRGQTQSVVFILKWISHGALVGLRGSGKTSLMFQCLPSPRFQERKLYPSVRPRLFSLKREEEGANGKASPLLSSLVVVDLPGLSPSTLCFLKQAERSHGLVVVVSLQDRDPFASYRKVKKYLTDYDREHRTSLCQKPVAIGVTGLPDSRGEGKLQPFYQAGLNPLCFFNLPDSQKKQTLFQEIDSFVLS